ncbi:hypothetical protein N3K66_000134 [Trichothecium roseum]|uniref:Uncharacterized protein n=1 Tax=Trichothecium roseum TaxID=47278 RepID=A0ACC0VD19_9HYPO|nr:hypothetical protein N3K66_000134 [Trichothecium roseum]
MKSKRAREATEVEERPNGGEQAETPAKKRKRGDDADVEATEVKKSKKDKKDKKKDKKPESRKEKKEKRKDILDLPGDDNDEVDGVADQEEGAATIATSNGAEVKKEKKSKKKKSNGAADAEEKVEEGDDDAEKERKKKEKKKAKKEKKAAAAAAATTTNGAAAMAISAENQTNGEDVIDLDETTAAASSSSKRGDRHIVFVGNLPFSATAASISAHFASLSPVAVRCMKNKGDDKPCRGIAFVEFGKVWHMRTCLDKFHHSMFDDKVSPARRINVELTAGGGGKNQNRQEKIFEKNKKLDENRAKRIEKEKTAKVESAADGGGNDTSHMQEYMHPSRRARVPGLGH